MRRSKGWSVSKQQEGELECASVWPAKQRGRNRGVVCLRYNRPRHSLNAANVRACNFTTPMLGCSWGVGVGVGELMTGGSVVIQVLVTVILLENVALKHLPWTFGVGVAWTSCNAWHHQAGILARPTNTVSC